MSKKLVFNKETKIIEVIEVNPKSKKDTVTLIISILSLIISIGALGISYLQKNINEKQADINDRRFNLEKKPIFECYIEQEELYNDEEYWDIYRGWLYKNEIKTFDEWYNEKSAEKDILYISEKRRFWDAYDNYDAKVLDDLTDGSFINYKIEYDSYIRSKNYMSYVQWKSLYSYKKNDITIKNMGAHITDAHLELFTFVTYKLEIEDSFTYSFAIDMNGVFLDEFWIGKYDNSWNYDSENSSFYIKYTQDLLSLYKDESIEFNNLIEFLSNDILSAVNIDENDINGFYIIDRPVYFCIKYLDNEQSEHTDWYRYYRETNNISLVETYESNVKLPNIRKEGIDDNYYEANSLRVAEILGYQNAQWRPFTSYMDYSYIGKAKQKIILDLKNIVNDM